MICSRSALVHSDRLSFREAKGRLRMRRVFVHGVFSIYGMNEESSFYDEYTFAILICMRGQERDNCRRVANGKAFPCAELWAMCALEFMCIQRVPIFVILKTFCFLSSSRIKH